MAGEHLAIRLLTDNELSQLSMEAEVEGIRDETPYPGEDWLSRQIVVDSLARELGDRRHDDEQPVPKIPMGILRRPEGPGNYLGY
jgi:hypothetical protein